jgi:CBS domain-containing protein
MAAVDPVAYLRSVEPFASLPAALFDEAAGALEIVLHPAGTRLATAGGAPLEHLHVIRKGAVRLERDGEVLLVLEEGETFGYTSLLTGAAALDVVVEDELLAYRLPAVAVRRLQADARFASHFAAALTTRLRASLERSPVASFQPDLAVRVDALVRRAPVWVAADATVGEAARVMSEQRISSVLVRTDPPGIVTDRDLRTRVLGAGLGPDAAVEAVASRPLRTVAAETALHDAWTVLIEAGLHHLPVTRDGAIVGVLTSGDVLRATSHGPIALRRGIERLASREDLRGHDARIRAMVSALLAGGLEAAAVARLVAGLDDALLRRILRWAESDLGPPPAPYAWIVLGAEGRREQPLLADRDDALVYEDAGAARAEWYAALAERVHADLEAAGFPPGGGLTARAWRGSVSEWTSRLQGWLDAPTPEAVPVATAFLDQRRAGGSLDVSALERILADAARRPAFLRVLAREALRLRPPAAARLRLGGTSSTVDLQRHGLEPIVALARRLGVEAGATARCTLARLDASAAAGLLERDLAATVSEAYRFLLGLRLRLQLRMAAEGRPIVDDVRLAALSAVERSRLKDALRVVGQWQEQAARRLGAP